MKKLIESALFISGRKLSIQELCNLAEDTTPDTVKSSLKELQKEYSGRDSPMEITEEAGKYKMELKPEYLEKVSGLAPQMDMNRAVLTTLSYIAYKQPIKQSVLVDKFGNRIYEYVRELMQRGLVRSEPVERTRLLSTTKKLMTYLGKDDLESIKSAMDAAKTEKQLREEIRKQEEAKLQVKRTRKTKGTKLEIKPRDLGVEAWAEEVKKEKQETFEKELDTFEKKIEGKKERPKKQAVFDEDLDIIVENKDEDEEEQGTQ